MSVENGGGPLSGYKCSSFGPASKAKLLAAEAKGCVKTEGIILAKSISNYYSLAASKRKLNR